MGVVQIKVHHNIQIWGNEGKGIILPLLQESVVVVVAAVEIQVIPQERSLGHLEGVRTVSDGTSRTGRTTKIN